MFRRVWKFVRRAGPVVALLASLATIARAAFGK